VAGWEWRSLVSDGFRELKSSAQLHYLSTRNFANSGLFAMQELGGVDAVFALTKRARPPAFPAILKLLSKNLFFWSGKRTTFFGLLPLVEELHA
jgi:hypothetical protein